MTKAMLIQQAIRGRQYLQFYYDGHARIVAPAAYGFHHTTGNEMFRGYQIDGTSKSRVVPLWDLFKVEKVEHLVVANRVFLDNPPGYRSGDAHLAPLISELS